MTGAYANAIYDVLERLGGANPSQRGHFVAHFEDLRPTDEWRFSGHFGFGGKYRPASNSIDYYPEDKTAERDALMAEVNKALEAVMWCAAFGQI